jgi:hypothetical protein
MSTRPRRVHRRIGTTRSCLTARERRQNGNEAVREASHGASPTGHGGHDIFQVSPNPTISSESEIVRCANLRSLYIHGSVHFTGLYPFIYPLVQRPGVWTAQ